MKNQLDWKNLGIAWAKKTDTQIAAELGIKRQNVSAARQRLKAPASPAGHGGNRRGESRGNSMAKALRAACNKLNAIQKAELLAQALKMIGGAQ